MNSINNMVADDIQILIEELEASGLDASEVIEYQASINSQIFMPEPLPYEVEIKVEKYD